MMKKRKMFESGTFAGLGNPEKSIMSPGTLTTSTPTTSTTVTTVPTAATSPRPTASDSELTELTKQLSKLALVLQGQPRQQPTSSSTMPTTSSELQPRFQREPRCIYCDSVDHVQRWRCSDLKDAMDANVVGYNTKGRLMYIPTGEEIPANFGRGGMKGWVQTRAQEAAGKGSGTAMMANVGTITFDDGSAGYGRLGSSEGTVGMTSLGIGESQWIAVDVEEKRKRGLLDQGRRVKPRTGESQPTDETRIASEPQSQSHLRLAAFGYPPPVHMEEVPDEAFPHGVDGDQGSRAAAAPTDKPKFRLASELNQTVTTEDVGRKIMEAPIQLRMCELLAVSPGVD
jgi:hypothetical protein